ncbi:MBL fold metallo-hydrolase [Tenacibaculum ovolyticum]|uniref:peptidase n=1 Tax=Tenacibaculum ovolyticum TaxID=104270 RepID=UPI001F3E40BD|nr:peptidase [Tenacibaculum ovolyticum]
MFKVVIKSKEDEDISILIKVANHSYNYLCDCGEAKELTVKECQNINAIFISHTHIDHFVNFDTILRHQIGIKRKVVICGPRGIIDQVQNRIKSYCWNLIEKDAISYEVREILTKNKIKTTILNPPFWEKEEISETNSSILFKEKDFIVNFDILDHKTASICYLFKENDKTKIELNKNFKGGKWVSELKKAFETNNEGLIITVNDKNYSAKELFHMVTTQKGKKVGVIMDHSANTENHKKIKELFLNTDEIYIECFYKDEDKEFAVKNYHSYASMSGNIMKETNVKNAIPVHFSRKYSKDEILQLIKQFERAKK